MTGKPSNVIDLREIARRHAEFVKNPEPIVNFEAEQGLLGNLMCNNRVVKDQHIDEILEPEHFADPLHGRIYAAIIGELKAGRQASAITLKPFFEHEAALNAVGGVQYLVRLAGSIVTVINTVDYARTIRDLWMRRQVAELGAAMILFCNDPQPGYSVERALEMWTKTARDLVRTGGDQEPGIATIAAGAQRFVERAELALKAGGKLLGLPTGLRRLDHHLGGLNAPDFIVVGARPSMGKTALGMGIAWQAAELGFVPAFFSLETSQEQLAGRMVAQRCGISMQRIRRGDLTTEEFLRVIAAQKALDHLPLYCEDTPALSVSDLASKARRLKREQGLNLIVVDYLQLMRPPSGSRADNRTQEVSEISAGLKAIAMELSVPLIALAQLSRAVEQREDRRPTLSDLRESGAIENDADVIMFLYRQHYYLSRSQPVRKPGEDNGKFLSRCDQHQAQLEASYGLAELFCDKNKNGPTGRIELRYDEERMRFSDKGEVNPHDNIEPLQEDLL